MRSSKDQRYRGQIGERFKEVRKALNLSRPEVAREFGITPSGFAKYENGNCLPGLPVLEQFREKYNISMDWLLFGHGPRSYKDKSRLDAEAQKMSDLLKNELKDIRSLVELMDVMPELREFLSVLATDSLFRNEVLVRFQKSGKKKVSK